jgi:redox-sensitive bicupin YhaK (pirin superfamily)
MIRIRPAADRGHFDHGWLDTWHTFSFGDYYDPDHVSFRTLRVMNDDTVQPGAGFGMHGHRDMEIITYVLSGALEHRDSLGNGEVLRPGELQRMTAGRGIRHSEFNPSATEPVHLYQIWLLPRETGLQPSYEQRPFPDADRQGRFQIVASPDSAAGSLRIEQDARVYLACLEPGQSIDHALADSRHAWLQVLRGRVGLKQNALSAGDGAAISNEGNVSITASERSEVMLFDLA